MTKRNKPSAVLPALLALACAACSGLAPAPANADASVSPKTQQFFNDAQKRGVISAADFARLNAIQTRIYTQHLVSDQDLTFWVQLLQRGPLNNHGLNRCQFETFVLGDLGGKKNLTPAQKQVLYRAILPYVSDRGAGYLNGYTGGLQEDLLTGNQTLAIYLLSNTRDPRALAVLANLAQHSTYPKTRQEAQRVHDILQARLQEGQKAPGG